MTQREIKKILDAMTPTELLEESDALDVMARELAKLGHELAAAADDASVAIWDLWDRLARTT